MIRSNNEFDLVPWMLGVKGRAPSQRTADCLCVSLASKKGDSRDRETGLLSLVLGLDSCEGLLTGVGIPFGVIRMS